MTRTSLAIGLALLTVAAAPSRASEAVLIGAGDIAKCGSALSGAEATARLLDEFFEKNPEVEARVFTLGDNAYNRGTREQFERCYEPTWGRHKRRTRPAIGNHDYMSRNGEAYFAYFGEAAGDSSKGYYSYDLGDWHVVVLNTQCKRGSCEPGSRQYEWLRQDLKANPRPCTVAYGHHPFFSSGKHGSHERMGPLFNLLYEGGVDLYLAGHEHNYERFAPQDPRGQRDDENGIPQFIVGTGGRERRRVGKPAANSEVQDRSSFGVLKLTLRPGSYEWDFLPVEGATFRDQGKGTCH